MFRVQFSGVSREQALERCCCCVQKLAQYVTVQVPDGACEELRPGPSPLTAGKSQGQDCAQRGPPQPGVSGRVCWLQGAEVTVEFVESVWFVG